MTFNFAMQAIDHIINSAAKTLYMSGGQLGAPIVFRGPNGAAARVGAQHSQDYAAWYSNVPGLKVVMPYTASDAKGLLKSAIRDPNPIIFLENEILYGQSFPVPKLDDFIVPIGKARIHRAGKDVTIVSWGIGMTYALKAAHELEKEGIEAEVIDLRTIRPMDIETVVASRAEDQALRRRRGGLPAIRRRRRGRHADHGGGLRLSRRAGRCASPARTCRCPTPRTSRSWRCRTSARSCRRRRRFATGELSQRFEPTRFTPDALSRAALGAARCSRRRRCELRAASAPERALRRPAICSMSAASAVDALRRSFDEP